MITILSFLPLQRLAASTHSPVIAQHLSELANTPSLHLFADLCKCRMQNSYMKTKCLNLEPGGPFTAVPRSDIVMHHCVATHVDLITEILEHEHSSRFIKRTGRFDPSPLQP